MPMLEVVVRAKVRSWEDAKELILKVKCMEKECSCRITLHIELLF